MDVVASKDLVLVSCRVCTNKTGQRLYRIWGHGCIVKVIDDSERKEVVGNHSADSQRLTIVSPPGKLLASGNRPYDFL